MSPKNVQPAINRAALPILEGMWINAALTAGLTASFLDRFHAQLGLRQTPTYPAEFLLELGALLRLQVLQRAGIAGAIGLELPPANELILELFDRTFRAACPASDFIGSEASGLAQRLALACALRLSQIAMIELGAEMPLAPRLDSAMLEVLADFLWRIRHVHVEGANDGDAT